MSTGTKKRLRSDGKCDRCGKLFVPVYSATFNGDDTVCPNCRLEEIVDLSEAEGAQDPKQTAARDQLFKEAQRVAEQRVREWRKEDGVGLNWKRSLAAMPLADPGAYPMTTQVTIPMTVPLPERQEYGQYARRVVDTRVLGAQRKSCCICSLSFATAGNVPDRFICNQMKCAQEVLEQSDRAQARMRQMTRSAGKQMMLDAWDTVKEFERSLIDSDLGDDSWIEDAQILDQIMGKNRRRQLGRGLLSLTYSEDGRPPPLVGEEAIEIAKPPARPADPLARFKQIEVASTRESGVLAKPQQQKTLDDDIADRFKGIK